MSRQRGESSDPDIYVPRTEYSLLCERSQELEVMRAVLDDLETAIRMGGLAGSTTDVAFVWSQNREALLAGETTWEAQYGPHRRPQFGSTVEVGE